MRATGITLVAGILLCLALLPRSPAAAAEPYRLQPGDLVEITVIEDPSLNRRVLVGPDGRITMPLAGSIVAGGETLQQVQSAVQAGLASNFVRPPTVTASLVALAPPALPETAGEKQLSDVYILGEVPRPGHYQYDSEKPISVLQALALAGGTRASSPRATGSRSATSITGPRRSAPSITTRSRKDWARCSPPTSRTGR